MKPKIMLAPPSEDFADYIRSKDFPCVGAKAALANDRLDIVLAHDIYDSVDDAEIHAALKSTGEQYRADQETFRSLAVIFKNKAELDELAFERALWGRLQALSNYDVAAGYKPDKRVSSDPGDDDFAMSFAGEGFFILAMHPGASRKSRRFSHPVMIFNLHQQFEQLRDDDIFQKLSEKIVARDTAYCGSRNPMLGEHGKSSSARQYSGRAVTENWVCPFSLQSGKLNNAK